MERGSGSRSGILVLELRAGLVGAGAVVGVGVADTVETRRVFPNEPSLAG